MSPPRAPLQDPSAHSTGLGDREVVLVVDDDPGFLRSVVRLLRANRFEAKPFQSADALRHRDRPSDPACFLIDIHLDGISGIDLHQELKQQGSSAPVIFMTGNEAPATRRAAEAHGCIAYLKKPFAEAELVDAVTRAMALVSVESSG